MVQISLRDFGCSGLGVYECCSCKYLKVLSLEVKDLPPSVLADGWSRFHFRTLGVRALKVYECCVGNIWDSTDPVDMEGSWGILSGL
jgi:hypothetical protein